MARTTLKTLLPLAEFLRNLAMDCLSRICLRGNLFIEPLPSNWNPCCYYYYYYYLCFSPVLAYNLSLCCVCDCAMFVIGLVAVGTAHK
jgi:hypothetical protein